MDSKLSIIHLVFNASLFVQFIIFILFLMLVGTLYITGKKWVEFSRIEIKNRRFDKHFWSGTDLTELYKHYVNKGDESSAYIFSAGLHEFNQFNNQFQEPEVVVKNCKRAMEAALNKIINRQESSLSLLATAGSSAPYIGLLGTVWGILSSFIALSGTQQSSIAIVAPGIAEALVATAIGLLAAIPSVLSYNYFVAKSDDFITEYEVFIEEFSNILLRQILALKSK